MSSPLDAGSTHMSPRSFAARRSGADGDTIVINSCAVTAEAVRQARQTIRKLKRERPHARIVVTGCAAQTQAADFAAMPEVDRVLGNEEKLDPAAWRGGSKVAVGDIMAAKTLTPHRIAFGRGPNSRLRAGAERLRSSLHVLHYPVWAREFALAGG